MENQPAVSCFCLTYGRPRVLDPAKGFFKARHAWVWNDGQLSGPAKYLFHARENTCKIQSHT